MRRIILASAMAVLVTARPDLYREKEDFQYSRSSSDEGTKSGFYDAQRGNMGGNYERAHNMDHLAQHQMGGLMKQVDGELGQGSRMRSGNVFSSANSQGVYGSGHYDLSSLGSRNFQDGTTYENSQSQSSAANRAYESQSSSSSQNNARYSTSSQTQNLGSGGYQSGNLREAQNLYGGSDYQHGLQTGRSSSRFYTQAGYQGENEYDNLNLNQQQSSTNFGADSNSRHGQVRIVLRPGQRVIVPINTHATTGTRTASYYNQNTENTEAEVLNSSDQLPAYSSNNQPKHYDSSYSYRKQWEKHETKPTIVPLIPANSELYDSSLTNHGSHYENTNYNQASSQTRHLADAYTQQQIASQTRNLAAVNSQQQSTSSSSNSNTFGQSQHNLEANLDSGNILGSSNSKPKSYQSSYSYHKSWERQGDPYIIKPATNGAYETQTFQKLTDSSQNQFLNQNYGSHRGYSAGDCVFECNPITGHIRKARSANVFQEQNQNTFNGEEIQQSQTAWLNTDQQTKWDQLEDLGQQTQNKFDNLEDLGQQIQNSFDHLENLGQQSQNKFDKIEDLGQSLHNNLEKLEDFGQQTQDFGQEPQEFGQQTQDFGQQTQDIGQQTQDLEQQMQDFGQQIQDLGQQTQDFGQQTQDLGQQTQDFGQQTQELGQQTQDFARQTNNFGQQTEDLGQQLQDFGQQTQDFGQQTQNFEPQSENSEQQNVNNWNNGQLTQINRNHLEVFGQESKSLDEQTSPKWNKQAEAEHEQQEMDDFGQQSQTTWIRQEEEIATQVNKEVTHTQSNPHDINNEGNIDKYLYQNSEQHPFESNDMTQQTQGIWNNLNLGKKLSQDFEESETHHDLFLIQSETPRNNQKPLNSLWDKIDDLDDDYIPFNKKNDNNYFTPTGLNNKDHQFNSESSSIITSSEVRDLQTDQHRESSTEKNTHKIQDNFSRPKEITTTQKTFTYKEYQENYTTEKGLTELKTTTEENLKQTTQANYAPEKGLREQETTTEKMVMFSSEKAPREPKSTTEYKFVLAETEPKSTTNKPENTFSKDEGRGDIGPEDFFDDVKISTTGKPLINTTPKSNAPNVEIFPTPSKPIIATAEIEDIPDIIDQTAQHESEIFNNFYSTQQETKYFQDENTQFVYVKPKQEENQYPVRPELEKAHNTELNNQNNFHYASGAFEQHNKQFESIGHQTESKHEHVINHFYQHGQNPQNPAYFSFHFPGKNIEEQNTQIHENGWKFHGYQNEHGPGNFYQNHFSEPHEFHHQQGFHHQLGFHHPHGFQHDHGLHQIGLNNQNGLNNKEVSNQQIAGFGDKPSWVYPHPGQDFFENKDLEQQKTDNENLEHNQGFEHHHYQKFEDFNQHNQEWNSEQQNMGQFPTDFSQQNQESLSNNENFEQRNENNLQNFGQQKETSDFDVIPVELNPKLQRISTEITDKSKNHDAEVEHEFVTEINDYTPQIKKSDISLSAVNPNSLNTQTDTSSPTEPTEKPGFWKSVGNKFTSAKNKVASWFGS